jgi:hypothetical protein
MRTQRVDEADDINECLRRCVDATQKKSKNVRLKITDLYLENGQFSGAETINTAIKIKTQQFIPVATEIYGHSITCESGNTFEDCSSLNDRRLVTTATWTVNTDTPNSFLNRADLSVA